MAKSEIRSPLPGTFYQKPAPDQPLYKTPGDPVTKGDTIGLIEVMKSFHPITSDINGVFTAYLIKNEEAVTAGQAVVKIES